MGREERVAIGRFVMRTKEYLVAIQVRDGRLALTTMRWGDEIRSTDGIDTGGASKPAKAQLDQAVALIEALGTEWEPSAWEDRYRARLEDVVERKRKGQTIKAPKEETEQPSPVPDLMAALEKSLAEARLGGRRPRRRGSEAGRGPRRGSRGPQPGGALRARPGGGRARQVVDVEGGAHRRPGRLSGALSRPAPPRPPTGARRSPGRARSGRRRGPPASASRRSTTSASLQSSK